MAQQIINNGESGSSVRSKLNTMFAETYNNSNRLVSEFATKINSNSIYDLGSTVAAQWLDGVGIVIIDDIIYQLGGWNSGTDSVNACYSSSDGGLNWSSLGNANWAARHTFGCVKSSDGYVYVVGGDYNSTATEKKEVWKTLTPGTVGSWVKVTDTAEFGERILFGFCEHHGDFYIIGGQVDVDSTNGVFTDVYKSTDKGVTWTQIATGLTQFGKNMSGCIVSFGNKIYAVCGGVYDSVTLGNRTWDAEIYSSFDGITWTQEADLPGTLTPVQYPNLIVWGGKLWFNGGAAEAGNTQELAYMDEAGTWNVLPVTLHESVSTITATHAAGMCVYRNTILRISGNNVNTVFQIKPSNEISSDEVISFITAIAISTIKTASFALQNEEGTDMITATIFGIINKIKTTIQDGQFVVKSTSNNYINIQFQRTGDQDGFIEYNANGWDVYFGGSIAFRILYDNSLFLPNVVDTVGIVAGGTRLYAKDSSDGNSTIGIYSEQLVEDIGTFTPNKKLKILINGVEYWVQLQAV